MPGIRCRVLQRGHFVRPLPLTDGTTASHHSRRQDRGAGRLLLRGSPRRRGGARRAFPPAAATRGRAGPAGGGVRRWRSGPQRLPGVDQRTAAEQLLLGGGRRVRCDGCVRCGGRGGRCAGHQDHRKCCATTIRTPGRSHCRGHGFRSGSGRVLPGAGGPGCRNPVAPSSPGPSTGPETQHGPEHSPARDPADCPFPVSGRGPAAGQRQLQPPGAREAAQRRSSDNRHNRPAPLPRRSGHSMNISINRETARRAQSGPSSRADPEGP